MKLETTFRFDNGKPTIVNRRQFDALTKFWNGEFDVVFTKKKKKRSSPQNKYYWACIVAEIQHCLVESQGEFISAEDTHEFLKSKFNYKELVNTKTVEIANLPLSTTTLSTIGFEEYLDKCRMFAYDFFDCTIPLPNEQGILI